MDLLPILLCALVVDGTVHLFRAHRRKKKQKREEAERQRLELEQQAAQLKEGQAQNKAVEQEFTRLSRNVDSAEKKKNQLETQLSALQARYDLARDVVDLRKQQSAAAKELAATKKDLEAQKSAFASIKYAADAFESYQYAGEKLIADGFDPHAFDPVTSEDLMCLQIKELRALYRENQKKIKALVDSYKDRYTTKANATIYQLVVLALEAEMQNILHGLGFGRLDAAIESVRQLMARYYTIATTGNQTIAGTLTKFIGQAEYYYIEAVKIEYEYYVKRERAREEQRALKEQMRQEAEERKILEQQRKQVEAEEAKYAREIARISEKMDASSEQSEIEKLREQLHKVQEQLAGVQDKRDEIIKLQNGKAGTVYVISNIGSFGEDVYKIGMTRRAEPMDRVRELGDASVPFPFDVHSFIFSEDAVALETKLHHLLNNDRVNKVNLRKEFFRVSLDRLQALVEECDPSAAFNRTALAEQYRQSQSIDEVPELGAEIEADEAEALDALEE